MARIIKMKSITIVSSTFGNINVKVDENTNYPNTLEIGNKRVDFSDILPETVDLRSIKDYAIIIYDGIYSLVNVIIGSKQYNGKLVITSNKHEEMFVKKL